MRKILFMMVLAVLAMFVGFSSNAQSQLHASKSTLTNADTAILTAPKLTIHYGVVSAQLTATNVSGTTSAKAYVQNSIDGVNYVTSDSATISGTSTHLWTLGDAKYPYFRIRVISSGTQSTGIKGYIWYK